MLTKKKKKKIGPVDFISVVLDRYGQEEIVCKIIEIRLSGVAAILSIVIK